MIIIYSFSCLIGYTNFNVSVIKDCFFLNSETSWFIKAYIGLYIISPALNACIEKLSKVLKAGDFELADGSVTNRKLANGIGIINAGTEEPQDTDHVLLWLDYKK